MAPSRKASDGTSSTTLVESSLQPPPMPTDTPSVVTKKRKKPFKRIKRFLTGGKSRKKKLATATANDDVPSEHQDVDAIEVDERSYVSRLGDTDPDSTNILKVIVLLMDIKSRRFELLKLEYHSQQAIVSDVVEQIPLSATEPVLLEQQYQGLCGMEGVLLSPQTKLATVCEGIEVLVAVPKGLQGGQCVVLAKPILTDKRVLATLESSGVDLTKWSKQHTSKMAGIPEQEIAVAGTTSGKKKKTTMSLLGIMMLVLLLSLVYVSFVSKTNSPLGLSKNLVAKLPIGLRPYVPSYFLMDNEILSMIQQDDDLCQTMDSSSCASAVDIVELLDDVAETTPLEEIEEVEIIEPAEPIYRL